MQVMAIYRACNILGYNWRHGCCKQFFQQADARILWWYECDQPAAFHAATLVGNVFSECHKLGHKAIVCYRGRRQLELEERMPWQTRTMCRQHGPSHPRVSSTKLAAEKGELLKSTSAACSACHCPGRKLRPLGCLIASKMAIEFRSLKRLAVLNMFSIRPSIAAPA